MLLNERLKEKLQMHLRGRVLSNISTFKSFGLEFMAELASKFQSVTYVIDDMLFVENDPATNLYYINEGKIAMIQKASHTYIKDLRQDVVFGEIGVLSG